MKWNLLLKSCVATLTATLLIILFAFSRQAAQPLHILVFSKTDGFRHASIEAGKVALTKMAAEKGFTVDFTEDATKFTTANLKKYNAVVFLSTTGDVLNDVQQQEFERYIQAG
ncbi:MAG TPA: ThuA domain-containing protein, partial [Puia sp.]